MSYYRLSPARVRRVLATPTRVEEGVAPKTIAMMQPASLKIAPGRGRFGAVARRYGVAKAVAMGPAGKEAKWTQEIWVMVQDSGTRRKVISAWRYPGVTKPRGEAAISLMRKEFAEFLADGRK